MSRCIVIDMASRADPIIANLKQAAVTTVFRYYASKLQPQLPEKRLFAGECKALLEAGLAIGVVYQYNNNKFESMNKGRGRADAEYSLEHATNEIKQPPGSAIYFGVDGDWYTAAEQEKVREYFEGVDEAFSSAGKPYRVGVYGSGTTCGTLRSSGLAELFWLPLSTGWSGTRDFYNSGGWSFYQNFHGLRLGGRYTDTNIVNPVTKDIGTFDKNGPVLDVGQAPDVLAERRFVKVAGVTLRTGPGDQHPALGTLRKRQNVRVLSVAGPWAHIDRNEDGVADGYCLNSQLTALDHMP